MAQPVRLMGQPGGEGSALNELMQMSLEDLMKVRIKSATLHEQDAQDVPATIYLTTADEIAQYGFFDLKQVLLHTPGVEYAYPHSWLQGGSAASQATGHGASCSSTGWMSIC